MNSVKIGSNRRAREKCEPWYVTISLTNVSSRRASHVLVCFRNKSVNHHAEMLYVEQAGCNLISKHFSKNEVEPFPFSWGLSEAASSQFGGWVGNSVEAAHVRVKLSTSFAEVRRTTHLVRVESKHILSYFLGLRELDSKHSWCITYSLRGYKDRGGSLGLSSRRSLYTVYLTLSHNKLLADVLSLSHEGVVVRTAAINFLSVERKCFL